MPPDPDVVDAKEGLTNEEAGYEKDAKGMHTVGEGAATATKADETEFSEEEIDRQIAQAFVFNFPLQYYIVNMARQQAVRLIILSTTAVVLQSLTLRLSLVSQLLQSLTSLQSTHLT